MRSWDVMDSKRRWPINGVTVNFPLLFSTGTSSWSTTEVFPQRRFRFYCSGTCFVRSLWITLRSPFDDYVWNRYCRLVSRNGTNLTEWGREGERALCMSNGILTFHGNRTMIGTKWKVSICKNVHTGLSRSLCLFRSIYPGPKSRAV